MIIEPLETVSVRIVMEGGKPFGIQIGVVANHLNNNNGTIKMTVIVQCF